MLSTTQARRLSHGQVCLLTRNTTCFQLIVLPVVLIILDRNLDLIPMVAHSWSYQALVNDVLEIKLNRVAVDVSVLTWLSMSMTGTRVSVRATDS